MQQCVGRLTEIWLEGGKLTGRIHSNIQPGPGQYVVAQPVRDNPSPLPATIFSGGLTADGFIAAPPLPASWRPGDDLLIKGSLGKGFKLPVGIHRLGLLAMNETSRRLLPLASQVLKSEGAVTLVYDPSTSALPLLDLPAELEIAPFESLPSILSWVDFLAIDLSIQALPRLRSRLGLHPDERLSCQAQVLVNVPMPCTGIADCGVCALRMQHGWKLACKDGPVFALSDLEW